MIEFLEGQANLNMLLKSVLADLKEPIYIGGCKAFGLISKLLLGPLWRILENNDVHMLDMGLFMKEILENLDSSIENLEVVMSGEIHFSRKKEWIVKKDHIYNYLVAPNSEVDTETETSFRVILPAISTLLKDHFSMLMSGTFSETDRTITNSVVKHNKFAERVFAYTDQLLKFKPNISHIAQEAYIMFCLNGTAEWLAKKTPEEREICIWLFSIISKTSYLHFKFITN